MSKSIALIDGQNLITLTIVCDLDKDMAFIGFIIVIVLINNTNSIVELHTILKSIKFRSPLNGEIVEYPISLINFIDRVVNACFDDGEFVPQYLDPVFMITLLQMTTNVPVYEREIELDDGEKTMVVDIEKTYELCKAINLLQNVKDPAFQALVAELRGMTVEKLDYMKQMRFCAEERIFLHGVDVTKLQRHYLKRLQLRLLLLLLDIWQRV